MKRLFAHHVLAAGAALCMLAPAEASAFCGFYVGGADAKLFNNATMVAMMRDGTRTVLSMQNNYQGPAAKFAMVVPVPVVLQKENVKTLNNAVFDRLDKLAAPRMVEYWEQDPCRPRMRFKRSGSMPRPAPMAATPGGGSGADLGVKIEAQFEVGEYDIVILSAKDSSGLDTWLKQNDYAIPDGAEPVLQPYVKQGMKFFVAKVNPEKVTFKAGQAELSPLRFYYDSDKFALPVRLGLLNAKNKQDLIVHILARGKRYEVANYKNVTIPTNIDLKESSKGRFGELYAALFDQTLERNPGSVVTEYAWDASTCDPCPVPALRPKELATLGKDILDGTPPPAKTGAAVPLSDRVRRPSPSGRRRPGGGFVLTRLHVRYDKASLKEDLVFREAPAISGGREHRKSAGGQLEEGAQPASRNNFQARYIIRHPWKGPIACDNPRRGVWGGPPSGSTSRPAAATDLAFAPRGAIQLAKHVNQSVPELGIQVSKPAVPSEVPKVPAVNEQTSGSSGQTEQSGCGACAVGAPGRHLAFGGWAGLLGLAALYRRRDRSGA